MDNTGSLLPSPFLIETINITDYTYSSPPPPSTKDYELTLEVLLPIFFVCYCCLLCNGRYNPYAPYTFSFYCRFNWRPIVEAIQQRIRFPTLPHHPQVEEDVENPPSSPPPPAEMEMTL